MAHINISVYGRVQRIGFRNWVKLKARYLGIKGFVKNRSDGSVFIEAEGEKTAIAEFVKQCRKGSDFSNVENIEVEKGEMKNFKHFEVSF